MSKTTQVSASTKTRRMKAAVQAIVDSHRSTAFNEAFAVMTAASPHGSSAVAVRLFRDAWLRSLQPGAGPK